MKKQILVIHGGETFDTYEEYLSFLKDYTIDFGDTRKGWKNSLAGVLGDDFEVILPRMPNSMNAKYAEWKIWFEKYLPYINDDIVLVGHSLGGAFLAKYLSENTFPKKIQALFFIAAVYFSANAPYSMADFVLPEDLGKINEQVSQIYLYHSEDDPEVPFADLSKFQAAMPDARLVTFKDKGHFVHQEEFPELVKDIQSLFL